MAVAAPSRVITERSATDPARAIREPERTAREVVEAHIDVCRGAHARINAIERALEGWVPPTQPPPA